MVLFQQEEHYQRGKILRDHGMSPEKRYWHDEVGYNYRMTNLQAAVGVAQMERVDEIVTKKIRIGQRYDEIFAPSSASLERPPHLPHHQNTYWLYTVLVRSEDRDALAKKLLMNGIDTRPTFYPLHEMPVYHTYARGNYPVTEELSTHGLSLPSSVDLSLDEVERIASTVVKLARGRAIVI